MSHILSRSTAHGARRKSIGETLFAPVLGQFSNPSTKVNRPNSGETYESSESSCPSDEDDAESNAQSLTSGTSDSDSDAETECTDASGPRPTIRLIGRSSVSAFNPHGVYGDEEAGKPTATCTLTELFEHATMQPQRSSARNALHTANNAGLAIDFPATDSSGQHSRRQRTGTIVASRPKLPHIDTSKTQPSAFAPKIEIEQVYDGDDDEEQGGQQDLVKPPNSPVTARRVARTQMLQRLSRNAANEPARQTTSNSQAGRELVPVTSAVPRTPGTTFHTTYPEMKTPTSPRLLDVASGVQVVLTPPTPREQRSPLLGVTLQGSPNAMYRSELARFEGGEHKGPSLVAPIFELAPGRQRMEQARARHREQQSEQLRAMAWLAWQKQMQDENLQELLKAGYLGIKPQLYDCDTDESNDDGSTGDESHQKSARSSSYGSYLAQQWWPSPRSASSWWRSTPSLSSAPAQTTSSSTGSAYSAESGKYTGGIATPFSRNGTPSKTSRCSNKGVSSAADLAGWWRRKSVDKTADAQETSTVPMPPASAPALSRPAVASTHVAPPRRVHFRDQSEAHAQLRRGNAMQTGSFPAMTASRSDGSIRGRKEGEWAARTPSSQARTTAKPQPCNQSATDTIRARAAQSMLATLERCTRAASTQSMP